MLAHKQSRTNIPAPGPGRPKGSVNKTTGLLREAILEAASRSGGSNDKRGLVAYLQWAAREVPGPFVGLLGKVLPFSVANDDGTPISFTVVYEAKKGIDYTPTE